MSIDISRYTVQTFTDYLIKDLKLKGNYRIRNLSTRKFYYTEDLDKKLNEFLQFQQNGAQIKLESGRYCLSTEKSVRVHLYNKEDDIKHFYFSNESNLQECKTEILKAFGISDDDSTQYTLHEIDAYSCMDSKAVSKKRWDNFVMDGDSAVLKNVKDATADELLTVHVNLTTSGLPHDCIPVGDLKISREAKLKDLKDKIATMDYFAGNNVLEECIRVRQKSSTNV